MERRLRIAFALVILAQAAHSVGFAIANAILVLFGIWCYWARVRPGHPSARGYAWFWACLELANGVSHLFFTAVRGAYFPGVGTAPLLIAASCCLGANLRREQTET